MVKKKKKQQVEERVDLPIMRFNLFFGYLWLFLFSIWLFVGIGYGLKLLIKLLF